MPITRAFGSAILTAAALVAALGLAVGCGGRTATSNLPEVVDEPGVDRSRSLAERLAAIQQGAPVAAASPLVTRIRAGLNALTRRCRERQGWLAVTVLKVRNELADLGIKRSIPRTLDKLIASLPPGDARVDCGDLVRAYLDLERLRAPPRPG